MHRGLLPVCLLGLLVVFLVAHFAGTRAAQPRLNVLFIIADDLNCDLGSYGDPNARTPNIDRLAARGVRFDRAYCQLPLCSPSRSSLLTGRRPNATGVLVNPSAARPLSPHFRETIPDTVTLPQAFRRAGWVSSRIGKLYHYGVPMDIGTSSLDDFASWDFTVNPRGLDREEHQRIFSLRPGSFGATLSWLADDGKSREQTDGIAATEAIRQISRYRAEQRPFFLGVGFYRPHTPFVAPRSFFEKHPLDTIELPPLSGDDVMRKPAVAYASAYAEQDKMSDTQRREAIQAYRASVSFMDEQLGRVLDALERSGLSKNTVIVFTSDHGYHLGDHGLWQKRSLFERGVRVPLIIAAPQARGNGRVARGLVELVDLYPTLAELAGIERPGYLEGTSLVPLLDDPERSVKDAAFSQVNDSQSETTTAPRNGQAIRTERWRYIEWSAGNDDRQLFDMETDPREERNLAAGSEDTALMEELRARLRQHFPPR